jgi:hypothetical protein
MKVCRIKNQIEVLGYFTDGEEKFRDEKMWRLY